MVVPHISRWFFAAMLEALESVLREADLDVLLYHVGDAADRRAFFERLPARRKVDAVVVIAFPVSEAEQQRLELMGVSVVAAGGQIAAYPYVCIDDEAAGRQAMDHLIFLGHRRIAMIAAVDPDQPGWPAACGRAQAYYSALGEAGIAAIPTSSSPWTGAACTAPKPWASCWACASRPRPYTRTPMRSPSAPCARCAGPGCGYRTTSRSSASTITRSPS